MRKSISNSFVNKNFEQILKACDKGIPEVYLPHVITSYEADTVQVRSKALSFTKMLQERTQAYEKLGLEKVRPMETFSLILDRYITINEVRVLVQHSQDLANKVGMNSYHGYMLIYLGEILAPSEIIKHNEILSFLISNVFRRHSDIRAVFGVPDSVRTRVERLLNPELASPVIYCPGILMSGKEKIGKDEFMTIMKESARRCGLRPGRTLDDRGSELYELVPDEMRTSDDLEKMVCEIMLSGKKLDRESVEEYVREILRETESQSSSIGFTR